MVPFLLRNASHSQAFECIPQWECLSEECLGLYHIHLAHSQRASERRDLSTEAFHGLAGDAGRGLAMVVGVPGQGGWSICWEAGVIRVEWLEHRE